MVQASVEGNEASRRRCHLIASRVFVHMALVVSGVRGPTGFFLACCRRPVRGGRDIEGDVVGRRGPVVCTEDEGSLWSWSSSMASAARG